MIDGLVQMDLASGETLARWRASDGLDDDDGGEGGGKFYVVSEPTIVPRERKAGDGGGGAGQQQQVGGSAAGAAAGAAATAAAAGAEDDAYILVIVSKVAPRERGEGDDDGCGSRRGAGSELLVFDAARIADGPVGRLPLPDDVPYGLHSTFVPWRDAL